MREICAAPCRVLRIATALLLAVVVCNVSFASAVSAQLDISDLKQKVVLIERARGGSLPPEIGAGFFVTPSGHILTAAHVLLNSDEPDDQLRTRTVRVRLRDGSRYTGRILLLNRIVDLALLKIRADKSTPYLSLGTSESVRNGNQLIMVGHSSKDAEWDVSSGDVERITVTEHIHVRATLAPGNSGGPAINADGLVVGVVSYRAEAGEQSYLVPVDDARMLLAGLIMPGTQMGSPVIAPSVSLSQAGQARAFQNSFLHAQLVSLKNFPSQFGDRVTVGINITNITRSKIGLALTRGSNRYYQDARVIDDGGSTCVSGEVSGMYVVDRTKKIEVSNFSSLEPGVRTTVLLVLDNCRGKPEGENFMFTSDWLAYVSGEITKFPIGFTDVQPDSASNKLTK